MHASDAQQAFYRLNARQVYVPIVPQNGVIHSNVLPGLQFRLRDLSIHPDAQTMRDDPVYQDFVLPAWRQDREALRAAGAEVARLQALLKSS